MKEIDRSREIDREIDRETARDRERDRERQRERLHAMHVSQLSLPFSNAYIEP